MAMRARMETLKRKLHMARRLECRDGGKAAVKVEDRSGRNAGQALLRLRRALLALKLGALAEFHPNGRYVRYSCPTPVLISYI
jgi:hypothetical protein